MSPAKGIVMTTSIRRPAHPPFREPTYRGRTPVRCASSGHPRVETVGLQNVRPAIPASGLSAFILIERASKSTYDLRACVLPAKVYGSTAREPLTPDVEDRNRTVKPHELVAESTMNSSRRDSSSSRTCRSRTVVREVLALFPFPTFHERYSNASSTPEGLS